MRYSIDHVDKDAFSRERLVPEIVLADDQSEMRQTVAAMLEREFRIVGLAKDGREGLELVLSCSPNVAVLDLFMPILSGIQATKHVKAAGSDTAVVILTVADDPDFCKAAMSVGALGYVLKPHLATDLVPAIRSALQGHFYVSPSMHFY
jgi:DNA-binding NarL/FixJ family response regulator